MTSFVGHGEELARLVAELPARPMVTLTGVGGVGKTRLATEAARAAAGEFPDGVWLCELAPVADPDAVAHAVATTLAVRRQEGLSMLDSVVDALRGRRLLLILDNCEHVLDAAAELARRVTASCPTVALLATSREPVGVAAERVWAVPSLDAAVEGVELFCDRAAAADAAFSPTEADRAVIAAICGRLDGIPLAIELAAARVRSMTPTEMAGRLDDRFRLLRGGRRGGLERHQTLRATVQWSHQLLTGQERALFDRLAVFAGGFDLDSAEAVCADDTIDPLDVGDLLAALVDKSMVVADRHGPRTRYRLLETLRQYGEERLAEDGELAPLRDRHLDHYLATARQGEPTGRGHRLRRRHEHPRRRMGQLPGGPAVGVHHRRRRTGRRAAGSTALLRHDQTPLRAGRVGRPDPRTRRGRRRGLRGRRVVRARRAATKNEHCDSPRPRWPPRRRPLGRASASASGRLRGPTGSPVTSRKAGRPSTPGTPWPTRPRTPPMPSPPHCSLHRSR